MSSDQFKDTPKEVLTVEAQLIVRVSQGAMNISKGDKTIIVQVLDHTEEL